MISKEEHSLSSSSISSFSSNASFSIFVIF
jgi:hypothetical protein